jgi:hypothetical protein
VTALAGFARANSKFASALDGIRIDRPISRLTGRLASKALYFEYRDLKSQLGVQLLYLCKRILS